MRHTQYLFCISLLMSLILAAPGNAYQQSFEATEFTNGLRAMLVVVRGPSNTFELSNTEIMDLLASESIHIDEEPADLLPDIMPGTIPGLCPDIQEEPLFVATLQDLPIVPYHQGAFPGIDVDALGAAQAAVPEPSTVVLLSLGVLGLLAFARKRKRA